MIYQFDFHIDLDNIIDGIKRPVIHFSNDGIIECNEDKLIKLFEERKKLLDLYRAKKEEIEKIKNKLAKYSEILCIGLNEKNEEQSNFMRTPRKDMFVSITAIIWIITNLIVYLITLDLAIVAVINMGFLLFLFLTLQDKKIMKWLNEKEK